MEYSQWRLIWIIGILFTAVSAVGANPDAPCYFPGGNPALLYQPCDQFAFTTMCCPVGWTCFSNHLCVMTDPSAETEETPIGTSLRPACTNPSWNDTACGNFCLDPGSLGDLTSCGNNKFCCRNEEVNGQCDCDTGNGVFSVGSATPQTIIGVSGLQFATIPSTRQSQTKTTMVTTTQTSSAVTTTSASTLQTGTTAPATQTATPGKSEDVTKTTRFKVGVGIGAAVAFCLLLAALLWCCRGRIQGRGQKPSTPNSQPPLGQVINGNSMPFGHRYSNYSSNSGPNAPRTSPVGGMIGIPIITTESDRPESYPPSQRNSQGPLSSNPYVPAPPSNQYRTPGLDLYRNRSSLRPVSEITEPMSHTPSPTAERSVYHSPQPPSSFETDVSPPVSPVRPYGPGRS